jgi:uncharacterized repeat protein (TIGR03803 family)
MNVEALGELGRGLIALDCGDGHLRLEGRRVVATGTLRTMTCSSHGFLRPAAGEVITYRDVQLTEATAPQTFGAILRHRTGPAAGLNDAQGKLFGTTESGGVNGAYGTIFSLNTNGSRKRTLHSFGAGSDGQAACGRAA